MEAVLTEAVALLDEAGESALTFRALAGRLGGGVASIYWYVASKDELLDRATDFVLGGVLTAFEKMPGTDDPIDDLRVMAVTLFDAIVDRPWLAAYFMRNTDVQGNSLRLYEKLGQQTLRLDLTPRQRFHAVSAVVGVVVGTAADMGQEPPAGGARRQRGPRASTSSASPTPGARWTPRSSRSCTRSSRSSRARRRRPVPRRARPDPGGPPPAGRRLTLVVHESRDRRTA